jgi:hypothetical protein
MSSVAAKGKKKAPAEGDWSRPQDVVKRCARAGADAWLRSAHGGSAAAVRAPRFA